jgi:hypothetical protein
MSEKNVNEEKFSVYISAAGEDDRPERGATD